MGDNFDRLPEAVKEHVRNLPKTAGLPDDEESIEKLASAWLEKLEIFEAETKKLNMEELDSFSKENEKGAIVLTYSGSLINLGPMFEGERRAEYRSIGLRRDVPEAAEKSGSVLEKDIELDDAVVFLKGPVKRSSAVYKIAVFREDFELEEEMTRLAEATMLLTKDFVEVNRTALSKKK